MTICGIPHDIKLCEDSFDTDLHLGQITYKESVIKINSDAAEPIQQQTLCHEIIHGILLYLGYQDLNNDEQFVQAFATAINQSFTVKGDADGAS